MIWDEPDAIDQKLGTLPAAAQLPVTWGDRLNAGAVAIGRTLAPALSPTQETARVLGPALHEIAQPGFVDRTKAVFNASVRAGFENAPVAGDDFVMAQKYEPILEAINKGEPMERQIGNPYWALLTAPEIQEAAAMAGQPAPKEDVENRVWARMAELAKTNPGLVANLPKTREELLADVHREQRTSADYADLLSAGARGPIGGTLAPFAGQMVGGTADPENLLALTMGMPASESLLRTFLQEGAVNAGITGLTLPFAMKHQADIGRPMDAGDAAEQVGGAFTIGGGLGVAAKLTGRLLAKAIGKMGDVPPSVRAAATMVEDGANRAEDNPFDGGDQGQDLHRQTLLQATQALESGAPGAMPPDRSGAIVRGSDINLEAAQRSAGFQIQARDPASVETDAQTMQYKGGANDRGVTDRLAGVESWDPAKAGLSLWYERADGKVVVADGHQRLALAKAISERDGAPVPYFGVTYREADGVSAQHMRAIAALKNIAEGSGSAVDAARVLRDAPEGIKQLPPRSPLVRQARDLMVLGDEAWGMTVNGHASERDAAIVGRHVKDPAMQAAILAHLGKDSPETATEAELFVRQALAAGARQEVQDDMFGSFLKADLILPQRVKILTAALSQLRKDKALFATLTDRAGAIEGAGNILNAEENAARQQTAARAFASVAALAERKGPISDALQQAAENASRTGNRRAATQQFLADVRGRLERGELDGAEPGGTVGDVEPEAAPAPISQSDGPGRELALFDDPVSKPEAFQQQTEDMAREIAPPAEGERAAPKDDGEFGPAQGVIDALRSLPQDADFPGGDLFGKGEDASVSVQEARAEIERRARAVERLRGCVEGGE